MSSHANRFRLRRAIRLSVWFALICVSLSCVRASAQSLGPEADHAGFSEIAEPFFERYCLKCHGPDEVNGDLRMDRLGAEDFASRPRAARWEEILNAINGYQMPPEDEPQPDPEHAGEFSDWILKQLTAAELARAPRQAVMRRLNKNEYNNTIRDLLGITQQVGDAFPEDAAAGGFDNNGSALTISPLHVELYYEAAMQALDHAVYEGRQPRPIEWRFDPEENTRGPDRLRVDRDGNRVLLNPGNNQIDGDWTLIRRQFWDTSVGFRDFVVPAPGVYTLRLRAYGIVPTREEVIASVAQIRGVSADSSSLDHYRDHPIYDYGPPRIRITQSLGGQPSVIAEIDIEADASEPQVYEIEAEFTTEAAGIKLEYIYNLPMLLQNVNVVRDDRLAVPRVAIDWFELSGPGYSQWPPESHAQLFPDELPRRREELDYVRDLLERFMPRAYRRPVDEQEIAAKLELFELARGDAGTFIEALKIPLAGVLSSPHFLYLVEQPRAEDPTALSAWEIASRLSYFLWSTMPDEQLFTAARSGELEDPGRLRAEVDRMLADPRSAAFVENFAGQWLGLREVGANPPVPSLYPRYDRHLEISMVEEAKAFFAEILHNDLDVRNFIHSDFVVVNERLARFYGINGVRGDHFRRVAVPEGVNRGGLLTQGAMHTVTSNGTRTSPVLRGVWVLRTMLAADPGLPVANVGEIAPNIPGLDRATVRQRLEMHREAPQCARCHNRIDPLGLALENFDASGAWRNQEAFGWNGSVQGGDPYVDARVELADGTPVDGVAGLQQALLERESEFRSALAQALLRYALGRTLGYADRSLVKQIADAGGDDATTLRSMISAIVVADAFTSR